MIEGTITSFNGRRGSGVIMPTEGRDQYIFHANQAEYDQPISPGARVTFEPERYSTSGLRATQVHVVSVDAPGATTSTFQPDPAFVAEVERRRSSVVSGVQLPRITEGEEGGMRLRAVKE